LHLRSDDSIAIRDGSAGSYWERVSQPLTALLERNNLTSTSNYTLQLLGGGSRVPKVKDELTKALEGLNLEKQLDADEAFALGGGLVAANLSTIFRLRPFGMQDGNMFPVNISLTSGPGIPPTLEVRFHFLSNSAGVDELIV
jgi:hypothetical protein